LDAIETLAALAPFALSCLVLSSLALSWLSIAKLYVWWRADPVARPFPSWLSLIRLSAFLGLGMFSAFAWFIWGEMIARWFALESSPVPGTTTTCLASAIVACVGALSVVPPQLRPDGWYPASIRLVEVSCAMIAIGSLLILYGAIVVPVPHHPHLSRVAFRSTGMAITTTLLWYLCHRRGAQHTKVVGASSSG